MAARNPFVYEGPVPPARLIDRAQELDVLQRAAADRVNIRLAAPRRYGKSSLLTAHADVMRSAGHRAVVVDFYRVATITDVAARVLGAYSRLPADPAGTVRDLARRLGLTIGPAGVTVQVGARGQAASLDVEQARHALLEVLPLPERLHAADGTLTVVAFDEFQDLLTADDRLDGLFRSVIQYHHDTAYIYAGSRPSLLREMFVQYERPFFGQARPLTLPPLPEGAATVELDAIFSAHGLEPGPALGEIVAAGEGHPQRTMLLAHHLYNLLADEHAGDLARDALERALEETADVHQAVWNGLSRVERSVVVALADGLPPTGQSTATQHAVARGSLQKALARMVDEQQVITEGPRLLDPLFAEWLRRR